MCFPRKAGGSCLRSCSPECPEPELVRVARWRSDGVGPVRDADRPLDGLCLTLGLSAPGVQWWSVKPTRETHLLAVVTAGVEPRLSTVPSEMISNVNATARPL